MAKGLRFFALFGELPSQPSGNPREYRLEFWFEGFTGTSTQIDMGGGGFTVSELSQDDEIEGVKAKKYNIQILRPFNATWEAEDFFALSEEDVEIRLFDRNTNQLLEKGYLTGDTLTDPYHDATKKINLEATCGLRRLKDRQYVTSDNKVRRGVTSLQTKLMDALRMTNLGLKVRISHHLAAVPMAVSNNSGLIVANEELHYLDLTAYDVLDRIARSANLTIFQDQGIWHIVHFYSKITTSRTYDEYDEFGNFLGTGTFPISNPAIHNGPIQPRNGNMIFEPPLKKVTVTWKLGKYKNYLLNDNFENFNGTSFANWELVGDLSFDNPGGYLTRTGGGIKGNPYRLKMGGWADTFFSSAFVKQTYTIAERPDFLFEEKLTKQIIFSGSAWARDVESINVLCVLDFFIDNATKIQYYLSQSGSWTLFAGGIRDTIAISTVDPNGKSKNSEFKWEIASPRIDTLRLVTRQGQQLTLASIVRVEATVTLRQGVKRPKNPYNGVNYDSYVEYANPSMQIIDVATNLNIREIKYVAENQAKATRTHEMEAFVGDFVDPSQNACLQFISGEITKQWYSDEDQSEREFLAYTARDYLRSRAKTRKIWEGNLWGKYNMFSLFTLAGESDKFVITGFNYQYHNGYGDLRLAQLNSGQPTITIKKFATLTDGSEIEMPLDGSLTTPEVLNPYMGVQPSASGPQEIEPNIFNLPNLTTVERGQLVFNTADNPFLGLQFADLSNPLTEPVVSKALEFTQDSVALFNNNKTVNIKMDWFGGISEANLKVSPLSSDDETIASREWVASVDILQDRTQEGPVNGIRDYRSIIFKQVNRMDFGFDDVLDVPYLFYSTSQGQLINFMDAEGRWNNVDLSGNVRRYAFVDELGGNNQVPTLQQVSERGSTSNIRLRFNGIPYLIEGDIPDLQAVSQKGRNSNQRLLFNNVPYATLNDIVGGGGGSVGTISQVLAQGNNTSGLDINVNNLGIIGTRNFNGVNEMRIGDNANVRISSFNTVALNATNIVFSGQNVNSNGDNALNVFEQGWELRVAGKGINFEKNPDPNNIYSYDFVTADIAANYLVLSSPTNQFGTLDVLFPLIRLGQSETSSIAFSPKEIIIGSNEFGPVKFNFHPATFVNGQDYKIRYNSTTNTFNMVPA